MAHDNDRNCTYLKEIYYEKTEASTVASDFEQNYWWRLPFYKALAGGTKLTFDSPVTFFAGENGCGKSTLIEAIAVALGFNAEGGSKNFNFSTKNTTSKLYKELTPSRLKHEKDGFFLRAESFYNVATNIDELALNIDKYGGKSLHAQSHGESFLALVQNRFRGNGLYILDEPEAALSPMRQLTLLAEMHNLVNNNSQFIIATHSPILLAYPKAEIYCLDKGIEHTNYRETEHYYVTRDFLNNPEGFIGRLLEE